MWNFQPIKDAAKLACRLVEEPGNGEKKKKRVTNFIMDVWEEIDPTPNWDIDDWIVKTLVEHMVDWTVEDMKGPTKSSNPS